MILSVITALVCFFAAILMFSAYFRKMTLLRPLGVYLIFQGAYILLNHIIMDLHPTSTIPQYIYCIGTLLIIIYYIFIMIMTRLKSKKKSREDK